jgi:hypothetical protein
LEAGLLDIRLEVKTAAFLGPLLVQQLFRQMAVFSPAVVLTPGVLHLVVMLISRAATPPGLGVARQDMLGMAAPATLLEQVALVVVEITATGLAEVALVCLGRAQVARWGRM